MNPTQLAASAGQQPSSLLHFFFDARLPGSMGTSDGHMEPDRSAGWTAKVGQVQTISASCSTVNEGTVEGVAAAGAAILLAGVAALGWVVFGRGSRRGLGRGRRRHRCRGREETPVGAVSAEETVTPPS